MGLYNIFIILYPWSQIACWSHCFYGIIQHLHHFVSMVPNSMLVTLFLWDYTTSSSFCIHGPNSLLVIVSMGLYNIFIILYPWSQIACWSHCFYGIIQHLHHFVSMVPNSMLVTLFLWDCIHGIACWSHCFYTTSSSFCIHGPK